MIQKELILQLIQQKIADTDLFLVDVSVKPGNRIMVYIDSPQGIKVEDCISVSRHIEHNLDRETEDFELEVSSPGLDQPFKVYEQYLKNIGRQISVKDLQGNIYKGQLLKADAASFAVLVQEKKKVEGSKKKQLVEEEKTYLYTDIKETKIIISIK